MSRTSDWNNLRKRVLERDRYTCQYCGSIDDLTVDHIWPKSKGGSDSMSNLVTACKRCNQSKGGRSLREWLSAGIYDRTIVIPEIQSATSNIQVSFGVPPERLKVFISALLDNCDIPISYSRWAGRGKTFSRAEFENLIVSLEQAGIIARKNPEAYNQGVVLTDVGLRKLQAIFSEI